MLSGILTKLVVAIGVEIFKRAFDVEHDTDPEHADGPGKKKAVQIAAMQVIDQAEDIDDDQRRELAKTVSPTIDSVVKTMKDTGLFNKEANGG